LFTEKPMFLVGVTGYLKPDNAHLPAIRQQVRNILLFLKDGGDAPAVTQPNEASAKLADWLAQRLCPKDSDPQLFRSYRHSLKQWKPLKNTPIAVMSALAPGADSVVAQEAIDLGMTVIAPMAFPEAHYRNSSSFIWSDATAEENENRQKTFDNLVRSSKAFPVPLATDEGLSPEDRDALAAADLTAFNDNGTPRRHDRYYAAGEYIASYCHLLLAIWDGEFESSDVGTSSIVLTRLRGPSPGQLSTTSHLALPNGGPVLHLFVPKQTKTPSIDLFDTTGVRAPSMRLLHPFSVVSEQPDASQDGKLIGASQHTHTRLQQTRMATFVRVAFNLERFNSLTIPAWQCRDRGKEFHSKRLVRFGQSTADKPEPLRPESSLWDTNLVQKLRRTSDLRCEATDAHTFFAGQTGSTLRYLFRLTMMAAVMLHIFSHWHGQDHNPEPKTAGHEAVASAHEPNAEHANSDSPPNATPPHEDHHQASPSHASRPVSPIRTWAGVIAFTFVLLGLVVFARGSSSSSAEQSDDTRALSEGLRVQFYWNLAGLGRSVSANYMQRQRSELDWIRGAIRAVSIPYHQWTDDFSKLSNRQKLEALYCVHGGWIYEQLKFFTNTYHKKHHKLHSWHTTGFIGALTGLFTLATCWWMASYDPDARWLSQQRFRLVVGAIVLLAAWRLAVWIGTKIQSLRHKPDSHATHNEKHDSGKHHKAPFHLLPERITGEPTDWYIRRCVEHFPVSAMMYLQMVIEFFTPTCTTSSLPTANPIRLFFRNCFDLLTLLPLSIASTALTLSLILTLHQYPTVWPSAENLGIIAGGVQLLFGAMAIAWVEKNLDSELSYQYNTMAGLFQHANQRMVYLLADLESCAQQIEQNPPTANQQAFDHRIQRIQAFIYEVGVEALDENAEWLILHRSRPMEPVMAG